MAGAGEALGAAVGTLDLPIKIAAEVRAWKEFQAKLGEGGVVDGFEDRDDLLDKLDVEIIKQITDAYKLSGKGEVKVQFVEEGSGSRIIGFRSPKSDAKLAVRLEWRCYFAHVTVLALQDLDVHTKGSKKKRVKTGGVVYENPQFGGFVNNVQMKVHNRTHIKGGDYAYTVGGKVKTNLKKSDDSNSKAPIQVVHVDFSLSPHKTNRDTKGKKNLGRDPRHFRYTIAGTNSVSYEDEEGNLLEVPRVAPQAGAHFTAAEIIALQKSAGLENQGVLFSLNKGRGKSVDVYAIPAKDLKVRTASKADAAAPATVRALDTVVVVGPHSKVLTEYLKDLPTCVVGTLRYSSLRGHGTWTFKGVGDLSDGIEKQVKAQFEYGELRGTKKTIKFE